MHNPDLQLMVHGDKIGDLTPEIAYSGITINKVHQAKSNNWLFIDLSIASTTKPGIIPIRFKKGKKIIHTINYSLQPRNYDPSQLQGFNSSDVIYLITPDRFSNGDTTNDVIEGMREKSINRKDDYARHGGDIRGIIEHLDYIKEMGFTAIWPGPILENDMPQHSYHGYAITDFSRVDPRFGSLSEYKELAEAMRAKGLKLIFDDVVNHSGLYTWWMDDLPFDDWLNFQDSMRITSHRRTVNEDPYAAQVDKDLMHKGWFVSSMPDLNQKNPFMATYLIQNSIWWIETLGLQGIRQDTYPYSYKEFLKDWTCAIMNEYPNFSIVAEEWSLNPLVVAYWQQGKANKDGFKECLKSTMDFPNQSNLVHALNDKEDISHGFAQLYEGLANDFTYANPQDLLIFGDNHDMDRLYTQLNENTGRMQMAITWLLTSRGIPQIYYGTEVLMQNTARRGDHGLIRSDFPGGWNGDAVNAFTGVGLSEEQKNMQAYTKELLNWRKDKEVIHTGKTMHFAPEAGVYVYFRYNGNDTVMVVMNKNESGIIIPMNRFAEIIKDKKTARNIITGEILDLDSDIVLGPNASVYELK